MTGTVAVGLFESALVLCLLPGLAAAARILRQLELSVFCPCSCGPDRGHAGRVRLMRAPELRPLGAGRVTFSSRVLRGTIRPALALLRARSALASMNQSR